MRLGGVLKRGATFYIHQRRLRSSSMQWVCSKRALQALHYLADFDYAAWLLLPSKVTRAESYNQELRGDRERAERCWLPPSRGLRGQIGQQ